MVLTKPELIGSLQNEVRILLHLASKVEPGMLEYRPTPGQRSTLELLQYLSMMGPALLEASVAGVFEPAAWTAREQEAYGRDLEATLAVIAAHGAQYAARLEAVSDADLRADVTLFGPTMSRGAFIVNNVLCGCAAYRTQLFLYLKACGRSELSTLNLWAGIDPPAGGAGTDGVGLSLGQFAGAWRVMCSAGPAPVDEEREGVHYLLSGTPIPFFNIALLTGTGVSASGLADLGQRACARIADTGLPWFLIVTHERLAPGVDPAAALEPLGLTPLMPLTGMRADTVAPLSATPAGIELAAADEDEACAAVLDVNSLAYGMDLETAKPALGRRTFWQGHHAVLGRADGRPATSAAVLDVDGHRYVAFVATAPECQRRGFAEAAMRRALDLAAAAYGERPTVLHATAAGRPIYERMGYQTIANHTLFIEKRFLDGH